MLLADFARNDQLLKLFSHSLKYLARDRASGIITQ
jgi:hypothetical protein